jgi:hypothetical protein
MILPIPFTTDGPKEAIKWYVTELLIVAAVNKCILTEKNKNRLYKVIYKNMYNTAPATLLIHPNSNNSTVFCTILAAILTKNTLQTITNKNDKKEIQPADACNCGFNQRATLNENFKAISKPINNARYENTATINPLLIPFMMAMTRRIQNMISTIIR